MATACGLAIVRHELSGPNTGSDDGICKGGQTLFFRALPNCTAEDNDTFGSGEQVYDLFGGAGNDNFIFADNAKLRALLTVKPVIIPDYTYTTTHFHPTGGSFTGFDGKEASIDGMFRNITALIGGKLLTPYPAWTVTLSGESTDEIAVRTPQIIVPSPLASLTPCLAAQRAIASASKIKVPLTAMSMDAVVLIL